MEKHLVLVAHSHGGNVAKQIQKGLESIGWKVDMINIDPPR